jgi:DNA-binding XRE family transcriptional regulator
MKRLKQKNGRELELILNIPEMFPESFLKARRERYEHRRDAIAERIGVSGRTYEKYEQAKERQAATQAKAGEGKVWKGFHRIIQESVMPSPSVLARCDLTHFPILVYY